MKVILCGYHWAGCKALDYLISQGHDVFVFTHEAPYHVHSVINLCKKLGISYSIKNISQTFLPYNPDFICSIYYRYIIKKPVIESCEGKIFNLHPSLLPKYRGCSSLTWALINGESDVGFTFHYIDEGCDTGNILLQKKIKIEEWDTQESIYMRIMFDSMIYFPKVIEMVIKGNKGKKQIGESSYYKRGCPYNGIIDPLWDHYFIERFIRAMNFPPHPPAKYKNQYIYDFDQYIKIKKNET